MDLNANQPPVARAIALALMRQALTYLAAVDEHEAARHLQRAIDSLLEAKDGPVSSVA